MKYTIHKKNYNIEIEANKNSAYLSGGNFGEISLMRTPLISVLLRNTCTSEEISVSESFERIKAEKYSDYIKICFFNPGGISDILLIVSGSFDESGVSWSVDVINDNSEFSVMEVSYPLPKLKSGYFDLFEPVCCGRVIRNAGKKGFSYGGTYPMHGMCMPYFAIYGRQNGVYLGIEDAKGAVKRFDILAKDDTAEVTADFYAINAGRPHNSFTLYGKVRWQFFCGDWYDATMIYAQFVYNNAEWLPKIGENGREDTAEKYKDISFWVVDYVPNSPEQGENMPKVIGLGSDVHDESYWYNAVIELQKELGVPVAYHVYNWHKIPFNIEYPHFLPSKDEFKRGLVELKKHNIFVMPYTNAVSWETKDAEMGHKVNFDNTGCHGSVHDKDGNTVTIEYPQTTISGHKSQLAPICPSFEKWHKIIEELSRKLEKEFDIDGIYYDEISAHHAHDCYNEEHNHLPGGGSHWVENYNLMMQKIRAGRTDNSFYFSECNAEPYMKSFDGQLTWMWAYNGEVPAFPAIYAGYTQMIGRFNIGKKADDFEYFKYSVAKAFLYGQQLGWCKADLIYKKNWLDFLKKIVALRYKYTKLFNSSVMLRPPYIICDLQKVITESAGFWFDEENIEMEQLSAGAWQQRNKEKLVVFLINISEKNTAFKMRFNSEEYELGRYILPEDFCLTGDDCSVSGYINAHECKTWELKAKKDV